ncbi:hypothetical protein CVS40_4421 [Lucilia cuprina]|nr:hypothetical protein CVS40_4421 [Lucilia cuprina]
MYCGRLHHTLLHPSRHPRVTAPEGSVQNRLGERQLVRPSHRDYRHRANPNRRRPTNSQPQRHRTANTNHQHHRRNTTNLHRRRTNTSSTRTSRQHPRRYKPSPQPISRRNNNPPRYCPTVVISEAYRSTGAPVLCATSNQLGCTCATRGRHVQIRH